MVSEYPSFYRSMLVATLENKMFCSCGTGSSAARRDSRSSVPGNDSDAGKH